jgi:RHH-type proline utilization regulon transcriptional repressor/proline dehydrogenase/delta 1-pyrroline-5-carboxylate dehydrogenase
MAMRVGDQLDPRALEDRTQAIGRALFAAAKREHAHLSVLNRWTAQVLSWCLSDPSLKSSVLQFIDVLPSLKGPREIVRHVREYFPPGTRLPAALRLGTGLARQGVLTRHALAAVITQLVERVARQFIAEQSPEGAAHIVRDLARRGATCSLDLLGEQVLTEAEADRYAARCDALLRGCAAAYAALPPPAPVTCGTRANLSVKPSALTSRFDPISSERSVQRAAQRLRPLLRTAAESGAFINLDMEQYELRDLTLELAKFFLASPEGAAGRLGIVLQTYLRDAEAVAEELLGWLRAHERPLTIRLVKGAYWDTEIAQARQFHWPVPVHEEKSGTDLAFERLTRTLLGAHPMVTTAIASHNVRSIAHAMASAEALGLSKDQIEFQLLYGMGDALQAAIVSMGYPVRVYTPVGELIPGMAYLVRRILENTSNDSFLRQDFFQELGADALLAAPAPGGRRAPAPPTSLADGMAGEPWADFSNAHVRSSMARALAEVRAQLGREAPLLIGAEAVRTRDLRLSCNPAAPSEVLGSVAQAGPGEAERALRLASEAQRSWAQTPVRERAALLRRAAERIRERRLELSAWEVLEVGKTWREADADAVETVEYLEYYSEQMLQLERGRPLPQLPGERNAYRYVPRGVAVVISPWNFPGAILLGMASAALVSGNAVILKPAAPASLVAAWLARALRDAGVPPGVLQYLPGQGGVVGDCLVRHPGVHTVLFTGSKAVGLSIIEACGTVPPGQRHVKRVVAEMGGKNAIIVDEDADLDAATAGILRSAFGYGGQKCSAASRLILLERVYEPVISRLSAAADRLVVGDPADPDTDVGPLIDATAQRRLRDAVQHAREAARVAYEYPSSRLPAQGFFVGPAIVTDVPRSDRLATEELFGPLLCVFRVRTFEEALELANDTDYALTGGVYSRSPSRLEQAIRSFDVGNLYLNRAITGAMVGRQPFGGHRLSGLGTKAGGPDYLLQLLVPKTVCVNTSRHGVPLD